MDDLFIIDGNAVIYQSYYAFKRADLRLRDGTPSGAFYGFARKIISLIKNYEPNNLVIAFDSKGKKMRHDLFEDYKANRKPMPDDLVTQLDYIKKFVDVLDIKRLEIEGFEADDIIGSIAKKYSDEYSINIYTPDKDLLQLLKENVNVIKVGRKKDKKYNKKIFKDKYSFDVSKFKDYLALTGDKSDNIPGVKGIGPKTAKNLLNKYDFVKNIIDNLDDITNKRAKNALKGSIADLKLSYELVEIKKDLDLNIDKKQIKFPTYETKKVRLFLKKYNFNSLLKEFPKENNEENIIKFQNINNLNNLQNNKIILFDRENNSHIYDISDDKYYDDIDISKLLTISKLKVIVYDAHQYFKKYDEIYSDIIDMRIFEYWYNYSKSEKNKEKFYKKYDIKNVEDQYKLYRKFKRFLKDINKCEFVEKKEQEFIDVVLNLEKNGMKIDKELLLNYEKELKKKMEDYENKIYNYADEEFNVRSPKQLGEILFEKMGLTLPDGSVKRTKTGYSTNRDVLEKLSKVHPIAEEVLNYRQVHKIYSTYVKPYKKYIDKNNRIYTHYDYCGTATGRLSSSDPNLQNIPIKGEWGNKMRKLFIPREGYKIVSADYSQMELRLLAHFSNDEKLKEIFDNDRDIHEETAKYIFGETDQDKRNYAKSINYGIVYGLSPYGLSQQLGISRSEAADYIEKYFLRFSDVKQFIDKTINIAREKGWVSVISGRRRYVSGIKSNNRFRKNAAERIAVNTPLQGSSSDILKMVMIKIYNKYKSNKDVKMISQIHDELLFEIKKDKVGKYMNDIKKMMEDISFDISVKMEVDITKGNNWWEAH